MKRSPILLLSILLSLTSLSLLDYERALVLRVEGLMKREPHITAYKYLGEGRFEFIDTWGNTWQKAIGDAGTTGGLVPKKIISIDLLKVDTTGFSDMFRVLHTIPIGYGPAPPIMVWMKGDSTPLVIGQTTDLTGSIYIYRKEGNDFVYKFNYLTTGYSFYAFGSTDIDQDGNTDVFGSRGDSIFVFSQDSASMLPTKRKYSLRERSVSQEPRIYDLDSDGMMEILYRQSIDFFSASIAKYNSTDNELVRVFRTPYPAPFPYGGDFRGYWAIGDFDKDKKVEFVSANDRGIVYFTEHVTGDSSYQIIFTDTTRYKNAFFHTEGNDLDRDGRPECYVGSSPADNLTNIAVYEMTGDNQYEVSAWIELLGYGSLTWEWIYAGDITGDGKQELLVSIGGVLVILQATGDDEWKVLWLKSYPSEISFRLVDLDNDGVSEILIPWSSNQRVWSTDILSFNRTTAVHNSSNITSELVLHPNYPNPFSNESAISFSLPKRQRITLRLYDINGKLIEELTHNIYEQGKHQLSLNTPLLLPGIYFVILQTDKSRITRKIVKM